MKKVLLILVMFFLTINVFAYEFTEWSSEYPSDIPYELIQSEERYLWYKEVISDVEYLPKEEFGDKEYDINDSVVSEWSEESLIKPKEYEERIIKEEVKGINSQISDIDHILITDITGDFYLSEITIFDTSLNEYIDYTFEEIYFDTYDYTHLNNGIYDDYVKLNKDSKISIDLGKKYDINLLDITLYYETGSSAYWRVKYSNGIFITIIEVTSYGYSCKNCNKKYHYVKSSEYYFRSFFRDTFYQYKDVLYKTYNTNIEYTNEYYSNLDGYYKDESKSKTFYRYITSNNILYDINGNVVFDENYCIKNFCILKILDNNFEVIDNPQTIDNINETLIIFVSSLFIIILILIIFSKNALKCHTNKKSSFVKFNPK